MASAQVLLRLNPLDAALAIRGLQIERAQKHAASRTPDAAPAVFDAPRLAKTLQILTACEDLLQALVLTQHLQTDPDGNSSLHTESPLAQLVLRGQIQPQDTQAAAQDARDTALLLLKQAKLRGHLNVAVRPEHDSLRILPDEHWTQALRRIATNPQQTQTPADQ